MMMTKKSEWSALHLQHESIESNHYNSNDQTTPSKSTLLIHQLHTICDCLPRSFLAGIFHCNTPSKGILYFTLFASTFKNDLQARHNRIISTINHHSPWIVRERRPCQRSRRARDGGDRVRKASLIYSTAVNTPLVKVAVGVIVVLCLP